MEPPPDPPLVTPATRPGSSGHRAGEQVAGAGEWWVELETKVREVFTITMTQREGWVGLAKIL